MVLAFSAGILDLATAPSEARVITSLEALPRLITREARATILSFSSAVSSVRITTGFLPSKAFGLMPVTVSGLHRARTYRRVFATGREAIFRLIVRPTRCVSPAAQKRSYAPVSDPTKAPRLMRFVPACREIAGSERAFFRRCASKKGCQSPRHRRANAETEGRKSHGGQTIGACRLEVVCLRPNPAKKVPIVLPTLGAARSVRRGESAISAIMRVAPKVINRAGSGLLRGEGGRLRVAMVCSRTAESLGGRALPRAIAWSLVLRAMPRLIGVMAAPSGHVERCGEMLRPIFGHTALGPRMGAAIGRTSVAVLHLPLAAILPTSSLGTTVVIVAFCLSQMGLRISAETTRSGRPATRAALSGREGRMLAFSGRASNPLAVCAAVIGFTTASIGSVQLGREVLCSRFCHGQVLSAGS